MSDAATAILAWTRRRRRTLIEAEGEWGADFHALMANGLIRIDDFENEHHSVGVVCRRYVSLTPAGYDYLRRANPGAYRDGR